ncbi:MAG TPA: hypothetical protein VGM83_07805 [Devosiaceae bacterium]|jgi:hypothetical protein
MQAPDFGLARKILLAVLLIAPTAGFAGNAQAQTVASVSPIDDDAVFVFGGRFQTKYFEWSLLPLWTTYEDNFVLGGGYQHFFLDNDNGIRLGGEVGVAGRFGSTDPTGELWAGLVVRYDGWKLGNAMISPSLTFGLSAETGTVGIEKRHEHEWPGGDASLLIYLGPELNLSFADNPNIDYFWRIQHRSGAWGTVGNMGDGANATTVGIRYHF